MSFWAACLVLATPAGSEACATCHLEQHAAWAVSRHAKAATNALFVANFKEEPLQWCLTCHAPLGDAAAGVGCSSCHAAPHNKPVTPVSCEGCHQVNFPKARVDPVTPGAWPMQNTFAEWRASGSATTCKQCHLSKGHAISGGHDLALVASALELITRRDGEELEVVLRNRGVPHRVPTGDPFRALRFELLDDLGLVVASERFGRDITRGPDGWQVTRDTTVPAGQGEVRATLRPRRPATRYRLMLIYVGTTTARAVPAEAESVVLEGELTSR
ncbi:MAG: hypothetical protein JNM17_34555 [Archangium sp.]|nr:hypothetical protein [Archangium sp.]